MENVSINEIHEMQTDALALTSLALQSKTNHSFNLDIENVVDSILEDYTIYDLQWLTLLFAYSSSALVEKLGELTGEDPNIILKRIIETTYEIIRRTGDR